MKRFLLIFAVMMLAYPASAQEKLVISIWGGSWRDLIAETVAKKFTQQTGTPVEFITGGTIDRLNKAKLTKPIRKGTSPSRRRTWVGCTRTTACLKNSI